MKLFNYYSNQVDKAWYQSSNIKYSECEDVENDFKRLKVVYNTGAQYLYEGVDVRDYIAFREASSQGKSLNALLKEKKLKYTKLEDANLEAIDKEYTYRSGNGMFINNSNKFELLDNTDSIVAERDEVLSEKELDLIINVLHGLGKKLTYSHT